MKYTEDKMCIKLVFI